MTFKEMLKIAVDEKIERLKRSVNLYFEADYSAFISHYQEEIKEILYDIEELIL